MREYVAMSLLKGWEIKKLGRGLLNINSSNLITHKSKT